MVVYAVLVYSNDTMEVTLSTSKELAEKIFENNKDALIIMELDELKKAIKNAEIRFGLSDHKTYF